DGASRRGARGGAPDSRRGRAQGRRAHAGAAAPTGFRGPRLWPRRGVARTGLALGGLRRPRVARPPQGRRPVVPELAGAPIRGAGGHRPGLPVVQQVLQPLVLGERPVTPSVAAASTASRTSGST